MRFLVAACAAFLILMCDDVSTPPTWQASGFDSATPKADRARGAVFHQGPAAPLLNDLGYRKQILWL